MTPLSVISQEYNKANQNNTSFPANHLNSMKQAVNQVSPVMNQSQSTSNLHAIKSQVSQEAPMNLTNVVVNP